MRQPVLFLSHGAPTFLTEPNATTKFWQQLPDRLPAIPRAILCISAHWDAPQFSISGTLGNAGIQHDFYGFPPALYDMHWAPSEDAVTAQWLVQRLRTLQLKVVESDYSFDHGVWIPLHFMWPQPTVPVYQLSLSLTQGLDSHWALGQALSSLRDEGVLIIGSGGITHNLQRLDWDAPAEKSVPWARGFVDDVERAMSERDRKALCQPWQFEHGKACHPTLEHYAPLLVAMGAAGDEPMALLHQAWVYGSFSLNAYGTRQS